MILSFVVMRIEKCFQKFLLRSFFLGIVIVGGSVKPLFSAAFSIPSSLINIPIASNYEPGEIEFGLSSGIYSYGKYENDFKLNYNISEKFIAGFTWANSENVVGNLHSTFFDFQKKVFRFRLGGGLLYITSNQYISSWDEYSSSKANTMANYLVSSVSYKEKIRVHIGRGKKRFETKNKAQGILGALQELGGVFFGFDLPVFGGILMGEFDGSDVNVGYKVRVSEKIDLNLAFTEMFLVSKMNPETQAPVRYFTFSFSWRENIFKSYEKKLNEAGREIKSLYGMVRLFEEQKKQWAAEQLAAQEKERLKEQSMDKSIAMLYAQAMEAELKDNSEDALLFLKQAYQLDPENLQVQMRLSKYLKSEKNSIDAELNQAMQSSNTQEDVVFLFEAAFKKEALGDYDAAIALIKKAIVLNPSSSALYFRLGNLYKLNHQDDMAAKNWEEAFKRSEEEYLIGAK